MELAALASAAVPGIKPRTVRPALDDVRDFDSAIVTDEEGNRWRVRSPRHERAAFRLETEVQVLSGFRPGVRAKLPFRVPSVAGAITVAKLRTFVYHQLPGQEYELDDLIEISDSVTDDIGRILAAIHHLPHAVVEEADLPIYDTVEVKNRLLNELDKAALSGKVPSTLLSRWEDTFEEKALWGFEPCVVHGDFHEDNLLIDRQRAVGVGKWTELHVGDPAIDLSWLASVESTDFRDAVLDSYKTHRADDGVEVDEEILHRATLRAEFALAQWLLHGIDTSDDLIVAEAKYMLKELAEDVEATGGQDIGLTTAEPVVEPDATTGAIDLSEYRHQQHDDYEPEEDAVITDSDWDEDDTSEQHPADSEEELENPEQEFEEVEEDSDLSEDDADSFVEGNDVELEPDTAPVDEGLEDEAVDSEPAAETSPVGIVDDGAEESPQNIDEGDEASAEEYSIETDDELDEDYEVDEARTEYVDENTAPISLSEIRRLHRNKDGH